ncbi:zf-CCHC domain-containing protein [Tanacetum coccineum]
MRDRISFLPDCLIVEILCRLESTKEAIRTSTLSKRWVHLWTLVPNIIFDTRLFPLSRQSYNSCSIVDQILAQCGGKLKNLNKFQISVEYCHRFESSVKNWIRYVINHNVKEFHLLISYLLYYSYSFGNEFMLPQSIFNNECFTKLTFGECIFNPTGSITWKNLKTLSISYVKLDEDLIQNILSGSPALETFKLKYCDGFTRIDVTSKSVENLVFHGYRFINTWDAPSVIEINAPYTLSLTLNQFSLKKLLLLNVSSLIKAELNCWTTGTYQLVKTTPELPEDFILNLGHVKELKLWGIVFTGNSQVKDNKIDLLVQQYEQFTILEEESIDITFLRALHLKWRAKVTAIEESKDLSSLALDELIGNLKVHEVVMEKDSEIYKGKKERIKYIALKAKKESSDDETSTSGSDDEEYAMKGKSDRTCFRCDDPSHLIGDCPKISRNKDQKAFIGGSWSDSENDAEDKTNDETCLMAQSSNEVTLNSSYYSDNTSSLDNDNIDLLEKEILELNEKIKKLERSKDIEIACKSCDELKLKNAKLKETQVKFVKFDKSANTLREMLDNQKSSSCKIGLGFDNSKASTSGPKIMSFVGSSAENATDGSTIRGHGPTIPGSVCWRTCLEPDEWIKDSGCSKHMTGNKSLFSTYKAYDGGKNKVNGKGKDKKVYIPKPNNPKPTAKERPAKDDACHHCKEGNGVSYSTSRTIGSLQPPYTPGQHNGAVRGGDKYRTLLDMVLSMMNLNHSAFILLGDMLLESGNTQFSIWSGDVSSCEERIRLQTRTKSVKCNFEIPIVNDGLLYLLPTGKQNLSSKLQNLNTYAASEAAMEAVGITAFHYANEQEFQKGANTIKDDIIMFREFDPNGSVTWKNLKTLSISYVKLDEDLIQNLLSGSPALETFKLKYCHGFTRIDVTSKSVKVFSGYRFIMARDAPSVIEINAPYTLSLRLLSIFVKESTVAKRVFFNQS